jgi:hypothetical protein
VVRASRELGDDRSDTAVGPFRVEVLSGLKRVRFVIEPNEWDFDADITWDANRPALLEPRHYREDRGRVTMETSRFNQSGSWSGRLNLDGQSFDVDPDLWRGVRDRSWGVRPVGEPEPQGIRASSPPAGHFWNYAPMQFDGYDIVYIAEEAPDGTRSMEEALRIDHQGGPVVQLGHPRHEFEFISGTREIRRARVHMTEPDGSPLVIDIEPLLNVYLGVGTGYGNDEDWRHGMYQGPLAVQGLKYDFRNPDDKKKMTGFIDAVARCTVGSDVGYGLWEYIIAGQNDRYGFKTYEDVAP